MASTGSDSKVELLGIREVPGLGGIYSSYLLSIQHGETSQIQVNPTQLRDHQNHPVQRQENHSHTCKHVDICSCARVPNMEAILKCLATEDQFFSIPLPGV